MPKEYTLIGGNGTRVSPLEVNESGTYEAGDSRAFNPVKVNVPSGSSTLSGLTDVDISNPTNGQTLVYNATSGKWENGAGGGDIFETLGTISAATVPMTYDSEQGVWMGTLVTDLEEKPNSAVRNFHVRLDGTDYALPAFDGGSVVMVDEETQLYAGISSGSNPVEIMIGVAHESHEPGQEPIVTNVSGEYYGATDELAILFGGGK